MPTGPTNTTYMHAVGAYKHYMHAVPMLIRSERTYSSQVAFFFAHSPLGLGFSLSPSSLPGFILAAFCWLQAADLFDADTGS
jgi:hypothetical protein